MAAIANDQFKIYYQEKLWELIPEVYRHEDGLDSNPNPNVLRALVEIIAEQAAILRRSQDRLWDDQFIELCNDWAVPYIGDLLATRMLSAMNTRGSRIDVAKTIYYRRRKGTPRVLEELIYDVSQWDGKLVEGFQRLVRARHGLDPEPALLAGRFTETMPGGTASLRSPIASELSNGPFEEYFHLPDFRKPKGLDGRYGISKLNFYLYRLSAFIVINSTPFRVAADKYCFDPSGRDIQLFNRRNRPSKNQWDVWRSALEWEMPSPIRCRLLGHAEYEIKEAAIQQLVIDGLPSASVSDMLHITGWHFRNEAELRKCITTLPNPFPPALFSNLLKYSLIEACGKNKLLPDAVSVEADLNIVSKEQINAGNLQNWTSVVTGKRLLIDPVRGRFRFFAPAVPDKATVTYHYGFSGYNGFLQNIGAGTYDRRAVEDSEPTVTIPVASTTIDLASWNPIEIVQVDNSATYHIISDPPNVRNFILQSANQQRPYLVLDADLVFTSAADDARLVLDGLWFGAPGNEQFNIILRGDYESVDIRNCTLDPGNGINGLDQVIHNVSLIIEGNIETLCIEKSILGPISIRNNGIVEDALCISDCIIQSEDPTVAAISVDTGKTNLIRSTVFGKIAVHRLYASDVIITEISTVTDTQAGCFRFSTAPKSSRLPRPYESYLFEKDSNHWFTSRQFGHHGFAQLSDTIPVEIFRGGENGAEMGAFNSLLNAIKLDGIKAKIEEYMPFGLIPAFINKT